ncbi:MAG: GIY-YIG nuclease family protein [Bacteroidetes bacterium]|nr:GIY-YIG nuclease family protein [Bacteroidota bacterium]
MKSTENEKQYIYIVQALLEPSKCKIGVTKNLEKRLKSYNNITGVSKENTYEYLYTCEVKDMRKVENDIKEEYYFVREDVKKEIYLYTDELFKKIVNFIKSHKLFVEEVFIKKEVKPEVEKIIKIVKRTTPPLDERGITRKDVMQSAQNIDNDEFYTRYEDVEKELSMYDKSIWKDKVVFCNCDDAVDTDERKTSAFALYFLLNFKELDLKKLICTHYANAVDLFNQGPKGYIYTREFTRNGFKEYTDYPRGYNGSFDHPLSLKILNEEADIVCTNPPFSRAIDYWKLLIESGKKFLIISNITNVLNTAYIPYFQENKVWAGYNSVNNYLNPKRQPTDAAGHWYTNFPVKDRPKYKLLKIMPLKNIPEIYKIYDDSKTLLVDNCYIPSNYKKPFAVSTRSILNGILEKGYKIVKEKRYDPYIKGKKKFARVLIQKIEK